MIFEHYKGEEIFVKKVLDYQSQALDHQRMILTPFLNPREQEIVKQIIGNQDLIVHSFGGMNNAENQRMIICPSFYDIQKDDFDVVVAEIIYPKQFGSIAHKDVLGALMNLGIKRDCIGDIDDHDRVFFACTRQTFPFIQDQLTQVKRSKVKIKEVNEEITIQHEFIKKTFFLSSLRLDKVVSSLYRVSRSQASDAIRAGFVKVNHKEVEEVHFLCHNNDMISFKRHGRVKIVVHDRTTKQGNQVIEGYFYK